jgi:GNAT superfamily N-acetyltransferase
MLVNDHYFLLRFCGGEAELEDNDPCHYMYVTEGTVVGTNEAEEEAEVGRFRLSYIDVCGAMDVGASVFDIFDYSQETCDYYSAIFDIETLGASARLTKLFKDEIWPSNVLILDRLEILPEFRGHSLGLVVMRRLIERFGAGTGVVAIKPFPLQHEDAREEEQWRQRMKLDQLDKSLRRATAKLRWHYAKLGFKFMKGTPFMFRNAERPLPAPDKLAGKACRDKTPGQEISRTP